MPQSQKEEQLNARLPPAAALQGIGRRRPSWQPCLPTQKLPGFDYTFSFIASSTFFPDYGVKQAAPGTYVVGVSDFISAVVRLLE